jgi:hypothetical protein
VNGDLADCLACVFGDFNVTAPVAANLINSTHITCILPPRSKMIDQSSVLDVWVSKNNQIYFSDTDITLEYISPSASASPSSSPKSATPTKSLPSSSTPSLTPSHTPSHSPVGNNNNSNSKTSGSSDSSSSGSSRSNSGSSSSSSDGYKLEMGMGLCILIISSLLRFF